MLRVPARGPARCARSIHRYPQQNSTRGKSAGSEPAPADGPQKCSLSEISEDADMRAQPTVLPWGIGKRRSRPSDRVWHMKHRLPETVRAEFGFTSRRSSAVRSLSRRRVAEPPLSTDWTDAFSAAVATPFEAIPSVSPRISAARVLLSASSSATASGMGVQARALPWRSRRRPKRESPGAARDRGFPLRNSPRLREQMRTFVTP